MIALILLSLGIAARSISELALHGKLRWSEGIYGFWDEDGWRRKYKIEWTKDDLGGWQYRMYKAPSNWYYRTFKLAYKERFPLSATFLVAFTDGYHLCQSISFF